MTPIRDERINTLRKLATPNVDNTIVELVRKSSDDDCHRVNVLELAASLGLGLDAVVDGFVHASKLGLFDMSWNMLCPGCGGTLDADPSRGEERARGARSV